MNEIIERCAARLYKEWQGTHIASRSWKECCEKLPAQANDFRRKAKAVIEELREPTIEMCLAPADAGNEHRAKNIWQAMIDEALK